MATSSTFTEDICVICRNKLLPDSDSGCVKWGIDSLMEYSEKYGDSELTEYLQSKPDVVKVHRECQRKYSKRKYEQFCARLASTSNESQSQSQESKCLRSAAKKFDWKKHCFLCGERGITDERHPERSTISHVRTKEIYGRVTDFCSERQDEWAIEVQSRLFMCGDLIAAEAIYHRQCLTMFMTKRCSKPQMSNRKAKKAKCSLGKQTDREKMESFNKLCDWLESAEADLVTVQELTDKAAELTGDTDKVYCRVWLKEKLKEKYGDHIFFGEVCGRKDVVCFRQMASYIVNQKWYDDHKDNIDDDCERIVATAAKLIKAEIREMTCSMAEYPTSESINSKQSAKAWLPRLLKTFLETMIHDEIRQTTIGHSIVQSVKPRSVIAPVMFGLGVSLDHAFGSRWLIDLLFRLGLCISYDEVTRFKQSVMACDDDDHPPDYENSGHFTQFAADNVDHNINTLDGLNTFHGMGIISISTPCLTQESGTRSESAIPRSVRRPVAEVVRNKEIKIVSCSLPENPLSLLCYKQYTDIECIQQQRLSTFVDILWHAGFLFRDAEDPRPSWPSFMHDTSSDRVAVSSDIRMLPIIDRNPNDLSCILSTLLHVEQQAKLLNMPATVITFDQPLWLKATGIIHAKEMSIVCRLGGFHCIMSFLGSIGSWMAGSGLQEALQCCYGANSVLHMLSGKAVTRAVRGHFLIDSALNVLLFKKLADEPDSNCLDSVHECYNDFTSRRCVTDDLTDTRYGLENLQIKLDNLKSTLSSLSRTAKLWLQYMQYVDILKAFIRAERTGNWQLHLASLSSMLNLFAATGHSNYARSGRLYLEMMMELPEKNPWLYDKFVSGGFHVARRSKRFWAGLSTDLTIEQVMMKSLKSRGGLTHGRGMTESVRLTWVGTMHRCATVHAALTSLTSLDQSSDDVQHAESGKSRCKRDYTDLCKCISWFESHSPFDTNDSRLHSLCSGVAASEVDAINCDEVETIGRNIMIKMDAKPYSNVTIRKADQVRNMSQITTSAVGVTKTINIESTVLFDRLIVIMERSEMLSKYFEYELTALPAALFKDGFMRKAVKSQLKSELLKQIPSTSTPTSSTATCCVLDGGALLHKVVWQDAGSYANVVQQYVQYVKKHHGCLSTVVFDGYCNGPCIKDHEHVRRGGKSSPDVILDPLKPIYRNQTAFLANDFNKKQFVAYLMSQLADSGIPVHQATDDADCLIASIALQIARSGNPVNVIADDTDILVLLVHHFDMMHMADVYMLSDKGSHSTISIRAVQESIGKTAVKVLPVIHAISGCDSTSALYGHGKRTVYKKLCQSAEFSTLATILASSTSSHEEVSDAGLEALRLLYGGKPGESLNHLRYVTYMNFTATSTHRVQPERMPPTVDAARLHIYRAHLQILHWEALQTDGFNSEDWGWQLQQEKYVPIAMKAVIAPAEILNIVRCKCKNETRNQCGTRLCSCRRLGLQCVTACKHCNGTSCENSAAPDDIDTFVTEDDIENNEVADEFPDVLEVDEDTLEWECPWVNEEIV